MRFLIAPLAVVLIACASPRDDPPLPGGAKLAERVLVYPLGRGVREGIGTPMIVPNGTYSYAAKTAVSAGGGTTLRDPDGDPTLAADFTAPLAAYFRALPQAKDRINGLFSPEKFPDEERLIRVMHGREMAKPVVLVHGLGSSPHTWRKMSAALLSSEGFRARYELWHYRYPTGAALAANAERFSEEFGETFGPGVSAIVVGHSMGGLLALSAATDPQTAERVESVILLASPAAGNWFATLPQAKIASSFPGIADLSMESDFIRNLGARRVPEATPVHVVLGRRQTFPDGTFTDGIVRSTDAYPSPATYHVVPARGHQIHKREDVIGIVAELLAAAPGRQG